MASRHIASTFACHVFGVDDAAIGIAVAAAAAAASAAQQQAAQARQRRAAAQSAQEAKQGMPSSGGPASSIAEQSLGQLSGALQNPRIQSMFQGKAKPAAGATDASLPETGPTEPLGGGATQAFSQGQPMMGDMQGHFQGQNPDYLKMMQQMQMGGYTGG